ncbi:MAG: dihydrodipicolinate synthase family protein [Chloroflexi bacterium]|nr:dihydrodipicolinate synthase family protein [Chloroflexota bacterium]
MNLGGLYPPITTPFDSQQKVALDKLEANLRRWAAQPLDGVVVPGSNSEAVYLSRDEKRRIWQVCADVLRGSGKRFIAGTGAESTAETIELTLLAAELGAEATLVVPPTFYRPSLTHDVLVAHYHALADASPIPILVYNVPQFTGVDFAPATLLAMAQHPRIIGAKDSSSNVVKIASVLAARPDFQVFAGTGSALLPFLSLGAVGGIMALANFAAEPLRQLYDHFCAGRLAEARAVQLALADLNNAVTARFGVPGLKYAMDQMGFYGGPPRRPLLPQGAEGRAEIDRLLTAYRSHCWS